VADVVLDAQQVFAWTAADDVLVWLEHRHRWTAGRNDAAGGRPRRVLGGPLARLYALGSAGGLVFRRHTWGIPAVDVANDAGAAGGAEAAAEPSVSPRARTEP
jgi:hypothetical protein